MAQEQTIHLYTATRTVGEFEKLAAQAMPLKRHGRVEMMVSSLAEPTRADMPEGGSPWHDYASYLPTWQKFFPHPKMLPFLDGEHIRKNRKLLQASLKVLRKHGYGAAFSCHTPFFMPEEFFAKYPQLRGARCDHPRRTRREVFAMCTDHAESQAMFTEMAAQMAKEIPELWWLRLVTNDAGAGLCWSEWLYPGPNGPSHCKHISTGQRAGMLTEAIRKGLGKDRRVDIAYLGNFSDAEMREIGQDENELFHAQIHFKRRGHPYQIDIGSRIDNPVRGIFDPVEIVRQMQRLRDPVVKRIGLNFRYNYSRGAELADVAEKVIEIVDAFCAKPAYGTFEQVRFLRQMCATWVGEKKKDDLLEALVALNEAYHLKVASAGKVFSGNYCGVSMRHINRPLVIVPELLTPEEEAYFLPHVFNPDVHQGRVDYVDWHGGKMVGGAVDIGFKNGDPRVSSIDDFCAALKQVAGTLDDMGGTPSGDVFQRMGMSLRLYACVIRSVNNFFAAGTVRDRNIEKLTGPAHIPTKVGDWIGDADLQLLNSYMRDELDNATEMIHLLESGGLKQMLLADRPEDEDTFLLGPDLIGNLKQKCAIMRRHWIDAQQYMSTPHK